MTAGPIDRYLDDLFAALRRSDASDARALLREAEQHLTDAADELERGGLERGGLERGGLSRADAEQEAVSRFGDAAAVATQDRQRGEVDLLKGIVVSGWWLGAIGAIAVGLSGLIVGIMRVLGAGNSFVAGSRSTVQLSASDCVRWLAGYPHAGSCANAALADWAWDAVGFRIALGVLGVLALGVLVAARRWWHGARWWQPLPATVVDTIATVLFAGAGLWLAAMAVDALIVNSGAGAGQWLSAAPIALGAALYFGIRLIRDIAPTSQLVPKKLQNA